MYCYYCGEKINEEKLGLLSNKKLLEGKIDNLNKALAKAKADLDEAKCAEIKAQIYETKSELAKKENAYYSDVSAENNAYICPRCGHLIHEGHDEKDIKSLAAASHAELQRGRNDFAKGMSSLSIALILFVTGIIFLGLSRKADIQNQISVVCPEFWVFIVLMVVSIVLISMGTTLVVRGVNRKVRYTNLLKDINNGTFVQ